MTNEAIFIIEDNQEVLNGIMNLLEYCEYQPEGVTRVTEEVFEKLKSSKYELIILDVMLSGSDGRDLARRFKETEKIKDIPILMISAYPDVERSARKAGADGFLKKPFGLEDLRKKVEQYRKTKNSSK